MEFSKSDQMYNKTERIRTVKFEPTKDIITLHGLGFLQIKLPGGDRMHVWHPALPRRKCFEHSNVHDHRFGFVSQVLVGVQVNQFYRMVPTAAQFDHTHAAYLHEGRRTEFGNRPWIRDFSCRLELAGDPMFVKAGEQYEVSPYIYHSTSSGSVDGVTVTLMRKTTEHVQGAHSLCKLGVTPDVDFDRKQWSDDQLWRVFLDAMRTVSKAAYPHQF